MPQHNADLHNHPHDLRQTDAANAVGVTTAIIHNKQNETGTLLALGGEAGSGSFSVSNAGHSHGSSAIPTVLQNLPHATYPETNDQPSPENANHETFNGLLESVNSFGALGSLYWRGDGHTKPGLDTADPHTELPPPGTNISGPETHGPETHGFGASGLDAYSLGASGLSFSQQHSENQQLFAQTTPPRTGNNDLANEPDTYRQTQETGQKNSVPSGNDDHWSVSGVMEQNSRGLASFSAQEGGDSLPDIMNFDWQAFVRNNSLLNDWEIGTDNIGWLGKDVYVDQAAVDPHIAVAWSMETKSQIGSGDFTASLLFKVGDNNELIYVGHKILHFGDPALAGQAEMAADSVEWNVEPGAHYVTSFIIVESSPSDASGPLLTVDAMEYSWHNPELLPSELDYPLIVENAASEASFAVALSGLGTLPGEDAADQPIDIPLFKEGSFQSTLIGLMEQDYNLDDLLPAPETSASPYVFSDTLLPHGEQDDTSLFATAFSNTLHEAQLVSDALDIPDLNNIQENQQPVCYSPYSASLENMEQTMFEIMLANS